MKCISQDIGLIITQKQHWLKWLMTYYWPLIQVVSPVVVLLDFSAAFDTIGHTILLDRLENIDIIGMSLTWLKSYLTDHYQCVNVNRDFF